ncbi:MAG: cytochrome c oxidase subunit 3 [Thermoplasmatota archaeon]
MTHHDAAHADHDEMHLPHGSIWPVILAMSIALVCLGLIFGMYLLVPGLIALAVSILGWVNEDMGWWKNNIGTGPGLVRSGLIMFISSEVFIFGALFASYFTFKAQAGQWPDTEVHLPIVKTGIFTLFLFASSATIHRAEALLAKGDKKGFNTWWGATILLGLIFLYGQADEYMTLVQEGQGLTAGQFMSSFYMITGTHGAHVAGGLVYLIIVWYRSLKGQFDDKRHVGPQTAAMYWHFVDLVWVFVFTVLYIVPWMNGSFSGGH